MAYVLPQFPMVCNIWHAFNPATSAYASPNNTSVCNLTPGRRELLPIAVPAVLSEQPLTMWLLLPPLTDVRNAHNGKPYDLVEVPAGSARLYKVSYVDDIGKGFANEHRFALINMQMSDTSFSDVNVAFPVPMT